MTLRRAGFDFVRLAVDPGPFLQFDRARRDMLDTIIADRVREILSCGLSVIVDFDPSDLNASYTGAALTAGIRSPAYRYISRCSRVQPRCWLILRPDALPWRS
jgi:endoglucanase